MPTPEVGFFSSREVAEMLHVSPRTVRRMILRGELESRLVGKRRRVPADAIRAYLGVDQESV